ncbi:hypothetical protein SFC66_03450 [Terribacillus saccharophilus]|uniref:hypothetical protein n=1 Tax=Terribacillus saccharophilus TaxID=361277 RepID=UPI0039824449
MNELLQNLNPFLPGEVQIIEDDGLLRLMTEDGKPCGIVDVDEKGQLIGFDLQIVLPEGEKTDAEAVAARFSSVFYPEARNVLQIEQMENIFVIQLSETDPIHQLPIPNTGLTVEIHESGIVTAAQLYRNAYTLIENADPMLVAEAKEKLLAEAPVMLAVQRDKLQYKLSDQVIGVHTNGTVLYTDFPPELTDIKMDGEHKDWRSLMGMTEDFVNYHDEDGMQLWAEKQLLNQAAEDISDQIAVRQNEDVLFYSGATPWKKGVKMREDELEQQAIQFLAAVSEQPIGEWKLAGSLLAPDAAIEDELEPAYVFLFTYTKEGLPVDGKEASIHVGIYSGLIRECIIDRVPDAVTAIKELPSLQQMKHQIGDSLELQLAWAPLQEEHHYELVYVIRK